MTDKRRSTPAAARSGAKASARKGDSRQRTATGQEPNFRFAPSQALPEDSYADGAANITGGRNVIKIDLYRVAGFDAEDNKEVRVLSHRIVLPHTAIPELLRLLQGYSQAFQEAVRAMAEKSAASKDFSAGDPI